MYAGRAVTDSEILKQQSEMLCNRIRKTQKHLRKWVKRDNVHCYRLYDRDIPEIPLVVDWYQGHLHVAEFHKQEAPPERRGRAWMLALLAETAAQLEVAPEKIFCKVRDRKRGQDQYRAQGTSYHRMVVDEGGLQFWVNLVDYLDTGLFLDHRPTRALVAREASGKAVLNLFCYTGSFSVYAAAAGAANTLSIDLSGTYLDWARANLELNDLDETRNRLVRGDVAEELAVLRDAGERFDLAIVDPPTFSNSKRMTGIFDVQRDHVALLEMVSEVLTPGGIAYFSTNHRKFRMDTTAVEARYSVEDLGSKTIPKDFRDQKIHRCWRLVHGAQGLSTT